MTATIQLCLQRVGTKQTQTESFGSVPNDLAKEWLKRPFSSPLWDDIKHRMQMSYPHMDLIAVETTVGRIHDVTYADYRPTPMALVDNSIGIHWIAGEPA